MWTCCCQKWKYLAIPNTKPPGKAWLWLREQNRSRRISGPSGSGERWAHGAHPGNWETLQGQTCYWAQLQGDKSTKVQLRNVKKKKKSVCVYAYLGNLAALHFSFRKPSLTFESPPTPRTTQTNTFVFLKADHKTVNKRGNRSPQNLCCEKRKTASIHLRLNNLLSNATCAGCSVSVQRPPQKWKRGLPQYLWFQLTLFVVHLKGYFTVGFVCLFIFFIIFFLAMTPALK